ncbi:Mitogen-activated protein kinase kinase kinase 2 [Ananas comosus]|uniref:Mitogen-activated protein kinase kinase kinase 2 n=1 Tax=Ananas comosus TaxID=4615 RepID=A0A199VY28_ANACO|nr:Mitogen-activated protein kinase kinase kinase 2 [Ananas comosus]
MDRKLNWVRGRCIGRGAFGAVSLAAEANTGEVFAVKTVDLGSASKESVYSIENEIEILRSIDSPCIVAYLGDDRTEEEDAGRVMRACRNLHVEYVAGGTVGELAERRKGLEEAEVRGYARRAARALRYLHDDAGVVHCDVKGRNLLAGRAPSAAKLADFGSAIRVSESEAEGSGVGVRGTPLWMAPEVARGERPAPASDVWSLGCAVVEMATGEPPWAAEWARGADAAGAMLRIGFGGEVPRAPARISKLGRDFLDKCLRRDPAERWSCDRLLRHPFLAEDGAAAASWPSPRSVLDWGDFELNGEIDDADEANSEADCDSDLDSSKLIDRARERVRDLDSGAGFVDWRSDRDEDDDEEDEDEDEWEMVRRGEKGEDTSGEFVDCLGAELEERDGGVGYASWGGASNGTRSAFSSSSCNSAGGECCCC